MRDYGHDHDDDDEEPYVVIEERSDVGTFLLGIAIGAGVALLFAPRSGSEMRGEIKRRVRRAGDAAAGTFHEAREKVEQRLESARMALEEKRQRVVDAVAAGKAAARDAAQTARRDINERLGARGPRGKSSGEKSSGEKSSGEKASTDAGTGEG